MLGLIDTFFWSIPFLSNAIVCLILLVGHSREINLRRMVHVLGYGVAAVIFLSLLLDVARTGVYYYSYLHLALAPTCLAISLTAWGVVLNVKSFEQEYQVFLAFCALILLGFIFRVDIGYLNAAVFYGIALSAFPPLVRLYRKNRSTSDLLLSVSLDCFLASGLIKDTNRSPDYYVMLILFGNLMTLIAIMGRETSESLFASFLSLEKELKRTQSDLSAAQEKLLKAERLATTGQVASMVGHDLRNPLAAIAMAVYYLKKKYSPSLDSQGVNMLETIDRNVLYADKIVGDLLDYSGEVKLRATNTTSDALMRDLLEGVVTPPNIEVRIEPRSPLGLQVDETKIRRAFSNVLCNSFDAMPNGGVVSISWEEEPSEVVFSFRDTGEGIPEDVREKIGIPFTTTKAKGMGLGLPICRRIVEAHGGRMEIDGSKGAGTTVRFYLPKPSGVE